MQFLQVPLLETYTTSKLGIFSVLQSSDMRFYLWQQQLYAKCAEDPWNLCFERDLRSYKCCWNCKYLQNVMSHKLCLKTHLRTLSLQSDNLTQDTMQGGYIWLANKSIWSFFRSFNIVLKSLKRREIVVAFNWDAFQSILAIEHHCSRESWGKCASKRPWMRDERFWNQPDGSEGGWGLFICK